MTLTAAIVGGRSRREWLLTTAIRLGILYLSWRVLVYGYWLLEPDPCAGVEGWGAVGCGAMYGAIVPMTAATWIMEGTVLFLLIAAIDNAREIREGSA